ncbi:hypothetical protein HHL26_06785 [Sphingobium sp. TB-6]|uniref:hypothetical protein n=1 Tax=Sphingobium sp. TB-6 TaxID=2728850 RepID=UPI00146E0B04|nr:hypothetical protein [Sphingobium sp. TB-6]NML88772.1 hypothetical protein [Sphingobium sp. TB-6]
MTNEQLEVRAAFDTIAARLDQGIAEFDTRFQISDLCRTLGMDLTDLADGMHDEMIFSLVRGDAETELLYTYMPGESGDFDHRYDLTEKLKGEPVRARKWTVPSAHEMQMTDLSAHKLG